MNVLVASISVTYLQAVLILMEATIALVMMAFMEMASIAQVCNSLQARFSHIPCAILPEFKLN